MLLLEVGRNMIFSWSLIKRISMGGLGLGIWGWLIFRRLARSWMCLGLGVVRNLCNLRRNIGKNIPIPYIDPT